MNDQVLTRAADQLEVLSAEERIIEFRAVPWNTPATVSDDGGATFYREQFAPGAFDGADAASVKLYWRHGEPVGRILKLDSRKDGLYGTARFSDTSAGRDAWTLARDGVEQGVSVGFMDIESKWTRDKSLVTRTKAKLREISTTDRPAYADAAILATRQETTPESEYAMDSAVQTPAAPADVLVRDNRVDDVLERVSSVESLITEFIDKQREDNAPAVPLFRSFGEYAKGVHLGDDKALAMQRAFATATSTQAAGTFPDTWVTGINGLVNNGRPLASAFGVAPLPNEGLTIHYPRITTNPSVAAQALQTDSISSTAMAFTDATSTVATYAGGGRVARIVIDRSSPAYLDVMLRALAAQYGVVTGSAFNTALLAAATANATASFSVATATVDKYTEAVAQACVDIFANTGYQADIIAISSDLFVSWAKLFGTSKPVFQFSTAQGGQAAGTLNLAGLGGDFGSIRVIVDTTLAVRTMVVASTECAKWHESPGSPFQLQDENIDNLGKDFAVFGYGTTAVYLPAGVRKQTLAA